MSAYRSRSARRARLLAGVALLAGTAGPVHAQRGFQGTPTLQSGGATFAPPAANGAGGFTDVITVSSPQAIIDWTPLNNAGTGTIDILPLNNRLEFQNLTGTNTNFTVLNRIVPADPTRALAFNGTVQSRITLPGLGAQPGGAVWFYTPGGFILNSTSVFDVGSLVLSTSPIDTSGGLFGAFNTIRFGQAPNPSASIVVNAGAQVGAASIVPGTTGVYVAMIAPQITQGGTVSADGGIAYIAGEAADVAINAGLFDITFSTGSGATNPIVHTGTTTGPSPAGSRGIVFATLAKNSAITMLLGGQIGYSAVGATTTGNGAIVLSGGNTSVTSFGGFGASGPAVDVAIGTAAFTSEVLASTNGAIAISPGASGQAITFGRQASLAAVGGVTVNVDAGETLGFDTLAGGLTLAGRSETGAASSARLNVAAGGTLTGGSLLLIADGVGTGGTAALSVLGTATATDVTVSATGTGSDGATAQAGTGGTASVTVTGTGASLAAATLTLVADGTGGRSSTPGDTGGTGTGGTATVTVTGGALRLDQANGPFNLSLSAAGRGGFGLGLSGVGRGGTASASFTDATVILNNIRAAATASSEDNFDNGYGLDFARTGGAATGGIVTFAATRTDIDPGRIDLDARATGGAGSLDASNAAGDGGAATGGTITVTLANATLTPSFLIATADARGGDAPEGRTGGSGLGGTIAFDATASDITAGTAFALSANGDGGYGGTSGAARGGAAIATLTNSNLVVREDLSITADGGNAFSGADPAFAIGGTGTGGTAALRLTGGTGDLANIFVSAAGIGGDGQQQGGTATGGTAELTLNPGASVQSNGDVQLAARAGGGGALATGGRAGNGTGGTATLNLTGATLGVLGDVLTLDAAGDAGFSNAGPAATGRGGTATLAIATGPAGAPAPGLSAIAINVLAGGTVANGNEAGLAAGSGGTGVGGNATMVLGGGTLDADSVLLDAGGAGGASAQGGTGGTGYSGRAAFTMTGGTADLILLQVSAGSRGGLGVDGTGGGVAGNGGAAGIGTNPFGSDAGAFATIEGGTISASQIALDADATGGSGGNNVSSYGETLAGGAGGGARGGIAFFRSVDPADVDVSRVSVTASAIGGDGGQVDQFGATPFGSTGGAGGDAVGGDAGMSLGGSTGSPLLSVTANGTGGTGGQVASVFGTAAPSGSTGRGGRGGAGTGGSAALTLSALTGSSLSTTAEARGTGGRGGIGPTGGDGGTGRGGASTATLDALGGSRTYTVVNAISTAIGFGGQGGGADGRNAGAGGDAFGGSARYEAVNGVTGRLTGPFVNSLAVGGDGGSARRDGDEPQGGAGGRGGNATGGDAELFVSLADITLVSGEGSGLGPAARAIGGNGGTGGTAANGGPAGGGGAGGNARAGVSRLDVAGGSVTAAFYNPDVIALGGEGDLDGNGVSVAGGSAIGGDIAVLASDIIELGAVADLSLGAATLLSEGRPGPGNFDSSGGAISIVDDSVNALGSIRFASLDARAGVGTPSGSVAIVSRASPIRVAGNANIAAGGAIDMRFANSGGLVAGGTVAVVAGDTLTIAHDAQTGAPSPSIGGTDIALRAGRDLLATGGSFVDGSTVFANAVGGRLVLAGARSTGLVQATGATGAEVGRITAGTLFVSAGDPFSETPTPGAAARFTGPVSVADTISALATGDIVVAPGAQVVSDTRIDLLAGDDILVGAGARLRAANNPPPETGYGVTDPTEQFSQLRLVAGGIDTGPRPAGEIAAIVLDGTLEAPTRTVFLSAQAIGGSTASTIAAANLYARVANAPAAGAPASNDGGQLAAGCVEGNVCLGRVLATNIVRIGETGFVPNALRLVGGIDAVDVLLRTRDTMSLGAAGTVDVIRASSSLVLASTGGDIVGNGTLTVSSGGLFSVAAARDIAAPGLIFQTPGTLALFAGRDIALGGLSAAQVQTIDPAGTVIRPDGIQAAGAIRIGGTTRVGAGDLVLRAGTGIDLNAVSAPGRAIELQSTAGLVRLASAGTGTLGTPTSVTLVGSDVALGNVTASGAITATARTGAATLANVDAGGALTVTAGQGITVTGASRGATIAFTSADLTLDSGAQLGSATTTGISLTSSTGRAALGGTETSGLWRLTDAELDRIRSNGDLSVAAPASGQTGAAFTLVTPGAAAVLIDGLSVSGGQFGANGTFRISSGGSIGIVGQASFDSLTSGQTVLLSAANDIALAAETGGIALRDAAGGLAGTLRLDAAQIHALGTAARTEAATLDLPALSVRLGTPAATVRDGGYFQAGGIVARVARAFLVQNSGSSTDPSDRRGLTVGAGGLRIEATGNTPAAIAANGRILPATTGTAVIPATKIAGTLDAQATINGCLIADPGSCTGTRPRAPIDEALKISRDVITEEVTETADEAARKGGNQGLGILPQPVIQILDVPTSPYDPVIDDPVTGTGNDDLWETTPAPGGE